MKLIAGITTKNEEWIIGKTLSVLSKFCDKIVVLDDNSTDKTEEICRSFNKVEWHVRAKRDLYDRQEAIGLYKLFTIISLYNPEYILMLDADEIPTPSFVNFYNNIDKSVNAWTVRMINLWGDEEHYRIDNYRTNSGVNVNWDPFIDNAWRKTLLIKYNKDYEYKYNLHVQKGGTSKFHPAPYNLVGNIKKTDEFYIIHYGKLNKSFINGDKDKFYANIDSRSGKGSYEKCLQRHYECRTGGNPNIIKINKNWLW